MTKTPPKENPCLRRQRPDAERQQAMWKGNRFQTAGLLQHPDNGPLVSQDTIEVALLHKSREGFIS
jgi:hypothetical protein